MFRALLAHLQEALHKRHLVYCVRVMSVGCTRTGVDSNPFIINLITNASRWFYYTDILRCSVNKPLRYICVTLLSSLATAAQVTFVTYN
jgi:hypothetical protein